MSKNNWLFQNVRARLTIRAQMALITGVTCIIAVGAAAIGAAVVARQSAVNSANRELAVLARNMADRLDQHMFERYREIQNIAKLTPLRSTWGSDPATVRNLLQQLQANLSDYAWLGFAAPSGTVIAATKGMLEGASVSERPWFINGLGQATVEDVHEAKLLDKILRTSPDEAPFRFVDIAMPVHDQQGTLAGVVGAHLSWAWANNVRQTVLFDQDPQSPADLWVVGHDGSVLLGPSDARLKASNLDDVSEAKGSIFIDTAGPQPTLTALALTRGQGDYAGLGWMVAARKPVAMIYTTADHLALEILLFGGAVSVSACFLAWILAGTVTRPLQKLAQQLDAIGGSEGASVDRQHGSRDLLRVSDAVRDLLHRVGLAEDGRRTAYSTIGSLQREAEDQRKTAEETMVRLDADLHKLRILADTDSLTGLLNRRGFRSPANLAWKAFRGYDRKFSVLMLDIDHFKRVNDTFGHPAGDEVIRVMGHMIKDSIRTTDTVARFGGEEFIVLLPDTDVASVTSLANRLRQHIAATTVRVDKDDIRFTISVGIALAGPSDYSLEDVVQRADDALYAAKAKGRNCVVADGPGDGLPRAA